MIQRSEKLNGLHADLVAFANDLANEVSTQMRRDILITEGYRSAAVQEAYYAQGRKTLSEVNALRRKAGLYELNSDKENTVITWALPCESPHQHYLAFDVYVLTADGKKLETDKTTLQKFYEIMQFLQQTPKYKDKIELGLAWGKYGQLDPPHVEIKNWRKIADFDACKKGLTKPQASPSDTQKNNLYKIFGILAAISLILYIYYYYGKK